MLTAALIGVLGAGIGGYFWGRKSTGLDPLWFAVAFGAGLSLGVLFTEK